MWFVMMHTNYFKFILFERIVKVIDIIWANLEIQWIFLGLKPKENLIIPFFCQESSIHLSCNTNTCNQIVLLSNLFYNTQIPSISLRVVCNTFFISKIQALQDSFNLLAGIFDGLIRQNFPSYFSTPCTVRKFFWWNYQWFFFLLKPNKDFQWPWPLTNFSAYPILP